MTTMKRLIKGIFCIVIVALLAACEIGDGEMGKTRTGKQIFDGWGTDMSNLFDAIVEPALQFNHYMENPEVDLEGLLNSHFSNSTLEETGERSWLFFHESSNSRLYLSMLVGNSLNDEGAILRIYSLGRNIPPIVGGIVYFLENMGNGQWILRSNDDFTLTLDFGSETLPASLKSSKLTISGNGTFRHETQDNSTAVPFATETSLNFNIHREMSVNQNSLGLSNWPYRYYYFPVTWDSGSVVLTATKQSNGESNTVEAVILDSHKVSITIGGVTQEWDQ